MGNLYLTEKDTGEFTEADEEAVAMLAAWAAIAITNARRLAEVRERRDELEQAIGAMSATVETSRALAGETDLDRVLQLIAKRGRALVGARALVIELIDGDDVRVAAIAGDADADLVGKEFAMQERVQSLGGRLRIKSAPGAGTTVAVRLPVTRRRVTQADPAWRACAWRRG
jgi:nitrate/nitrite-specific signal transduction histidine kinase